MRKTIHGHAVRPRLSGGRNERGPGRRRRNARWMPVAVVVLTVLGFGACAPDVFGPDRRTPASIRLLQSALTIDRLQQDIVFEAQVLDGRGRPALDASLDWTVADPGILEPRGAGRFRTVGNGTTTVRVSVVGAPQITAEATVTVAQRAVGVTIVPGSVTLAAIGAEQWLEAEAVDGNGIPVGNAAFQWESTDPSVASVDEAGKATAVADGTVLIRAVVQGSDVTGTAQLAVRATFRSQACIVAALPYHADPQTACASTHMTVRVR